MFEPCTLHMVAMTYAFCTVFVIDFCQLMKDNLS